MRLAITSVVLLAVLLSSPSAFAQGGSLGVYADPDGTISEIVPEVGVPFNIYVVLFEEAIVNAVAYKLEIPGLNNDIFIQGVTYGQGGIGINIPNSGGENIGLGECAIGFSGAPILVATYQLVMTVSPEPVRTIEIKPNVLADPDTPIYSDCQGFLHPVPVGPSLKVGNGTVQIQERSWGGIKAVYR